MNAIKYIKPQNLLAPHLHSENLNVKIWEKHRTPMMRTENFPLIYQENPDVEEQQATEPSITNIHNINFFLKHFERILHTNLEDKTNLQSFFPLYSLQNIQKHTQKIAQNVRFFQENMQQKMFSKTLQKQYQYWYKTSHSKNIVDTTMQRKSTFLQILNQSRTKRSVQKVLQVVNNLTYGMPAQYIEEIQKTNNTNAATTNTTNTSGNTLLQVLNNLAYMLPGNNASLTTMPQQNVRGASYTTLQRKHMQTQKMLQVAHNLTYGTPVQYVEEIHKAGNTNAATTNTTNTSGNALLQVLNNLAYMLPGNNVSLTTMPQQNVRGASYTTLQRKHMQTQRMLQVAHNLTYGTPVQYVEEIHKAGNTNAATTNTTNTSGNTLLQVLNNLAYMLPGNNSSLTTMQQQNVRGASYTTLQRKHMQTQKMLQVAHNLTYGTPVQYVEEIHKAGNTNAATTNTTNTSGNTLLQVLNNLAYMLPGNNSSLTTMQQQNVRGASYTTIQRKHMQTQKMLQVAHNLTYGTPVQYVEEIQKAGNTNAVTTNTVTNNSGNTLQQVLNNLAYMLPGNNSSLTTMQQQNVRGASYTTLQRKHMQTQKMLQVAHNLTYGMPAQYIEEIHKAGNTNAVTTNTTKTSGNTNTTKTSGNVLLQVLNNLAYMLPVNNASLTTMQQQNVRGASYTTIQRKHMQTQKMLQVAHNLTYGTPVQYVEEIHKAGDTKAVTANTVTNNSGSTLQQVLNNLAYMLPGNNASLTTMQQQNVRGASYTTIQRKHMQTQKMLQVAHNLTYGTPVQYVEEIHKAGDTKAATANTVTNNSGSTLQQVLNNLAYMLPGNNASLTTMPQQNVRGASYTTLQRKHMQTQKMLQVAHNLTYGMPAQYIEEAQKTSNTNLVTNNTRGNTLLQVLNNLAYMLPGNNSLFTTIQQQNVRGTSYTTLQRKNMQTQKMLQVAHNLTYGMPAQYIEEIQKTGNTNNVAKHTSGNTLQKVLNNLVHIFSVGNSSNIKSQKLVDLQKMLQVTNYYKVPQIENNVAYTTSGNMHKTFHELMYGRSVENSQIFSPKNVQVLSQKLVNLKDRVANKFTQLHNKYFFTANNPLSHRVYINHEAEVKPTLSPQQSLQYKRHEPTPKYMAVRREPLPLKYKENQPPQSIVAEKKQPKKNHKTTHIHVSDAKINSIATRVYKILEKKMSIEKNRRGLF